jgi:hypothetical protein
LLNSSNAIQSPGKKDFFAHSPRSLPVIHAANGMWRLEEGGSITRHDFDPKFMSELLEPVLIVTKEMQSEEERKAAEELGRKDIDALQRYWGLILIGGNRAQQILMLLGEGGTGKGTIVRLTGMILGRSNVGQLRVGELNGRFETSKLVGKRLLTVVEAPHDCLEQRGAEQLKAVVGHDLLDGDKKYVQDPIPFEGTFPVIYVSNEDPNIRLSGDESAWSGDWLSSCSRTSGQRAASLSTGPEHPGACFATLIQICNYTIQGYKRNSSVLNNNGRRRSGMLRNSLSTLKLYYDTMRSTQKPSFNDLIRDRVLAYMDKIPPAVSGERGHNQTFKVAVVLVWGFCLSRDEAMEYLRLYNGRCLPPWTEAELAHKVDSAISDCNTKWRAGAQLKPPGYLRCYNKRAFGNQESEIS